MTEDKTPFIFFADNSDMKQTFISTVAVASDFVHDHVAIIVTTHNRAEALTIHGWDEAAKLQIALERHKSYESKKWTITAKDNPSLEGIYND